MLDVTLMRRWAVKIWRLKSEPLVGKGSGPLQYPQETLLILSKVLLQFS